MEFQLIKVHVEVFSRIMHGLPFMTSEARVLRGKGPSIKQIAISMSYSFGMADAFKKCRIFGRQGKGLLLKEVVRGWTRGENRIG